MIYQRDNRFFPRACSLRLQIFAFVNRAVFCRAIASSKWQGRRNFELMGESSRALLINETPPIYAHAHEPLQISRRRDVPAALFDESRFRLILVFCAASGCYWRFPLLGRFLFEAALGEKGKCAFGTNEARWFTRGRNKNAESGSIRHGWQCARTYLTGELWNDWLSFKLLVRSECKMWGLRGVFL